MSSLRGRTRDSSWQWLVIGVILGLGCSSVVCLGGYAANLLQFNLPGQAPTEIPTSQVMIVTSTPPPATATPLVTPTVAVTTAVPQQASTAAANVVNLTPSSTGYSVQPTDVKATKSSPAVVNTPQPVSLAST